MDQLDNQYLVILFGSVFFALVITIFVIAIVYAHQIRQRKNKNKLKQLKSAYEKILLDVKNEIQQETLSYVGSELHDNIGQLLSLTKLNLNSGKPEKISESKKLIAKIIGEVRALSKTLDTGWVHEINLEKFVRNELKKMESVGFCKTELQTNITSQNIPKDKKLVLIRAIQECLNNIMKHSSPTLISVELSVDFTGLTIKINDDGGGFNPNEKTAGTGLQNLKKRMETLSGSFSLSSEIGKGTQITLALPL